MHSQAGFRHDSRVESQGSKPSQAAVQLLRSAVAGLPLFEILDREKRELRAPAIQGSAVPKLEPEERPDAAAASQFFGGFTLHYLDRQAVVHDEAGQDAVEADLP